MSAIFAEFSIALGISTVILFLVGEIGLSMLSFAMLAALIKATENTT